MAALKMISDAERSSAGSRNVGAYLAFTKHARQRSKFSYARPSPATSRLSGHEEPSVRLINPSFNITPCHTVFFLERTPQSPGAGELSLPIPGAACSAGNCLQI